MGEFGDIVASEASSVLLDMMENHRKDLVVIFAGYKDRLNAFFEKNQGLKSRIPVSIHFEDYDPGELEEIFMKMCEKHGFTVDNSAIDKFEELMEQSRRSKDFANARTVRNIFEEVYRKHAVRTVESGCLETDDYIISNEDMEINADFEDAKCPLGFM